MYSSARKCLNYSEISNAPFLELTEFQLSRLKSCVVDLSQSLKNPDYTLYAPEMSTLHSTISIAHFA